MYNEPPPLELEEVFPVSARDIGAVRRASIESIFSNDLSKRAESINYLKFRFPNLMAGGVRGDYVILEVQLDSCKRIIRAAQIPKKLMDVGQHYFEL